MGKAFACRASHETMEPSIATGTKPDDGVSGRLLAWYDAHHRDLPWRVSPAAQAAGERPDPYRVWLSEVMLQQTTVQAVGAYYLKFLRAWPTVGALAAAPLDDVLAL